MNQLPPIFSQAILSLPVNQPVYLDSGPGTVPVDGSTFWMAVVSRECTSVSYKEFTAQEESETTAWQVTTTHGQILTLSALVVARTKAIRELVLPPDLRRGDRLVSCNTESTSKSYTFFHLQGGFTSPRHVEVVKATQNSNLKGHVVHHKDRDRWNDSRDNLVPVKAGKHPRVHALDRIFQREPKPPRPPSDHPDRRMLTMATRRILRKHPDIGKATLMVRIAEETGVSPTDVLRATRNQYGTLFSLIQAALPKNVEVIEVKPVQGVVVARLLPVDPDVSDIRVVLPYINGEGHFQRMPLIASE